MKIHPVASRPPSGQAGFTLFEMLVTFAIIAVLALLSMEAFRNMRQSADATKSVSSLRQNAAAIQSYVAENTRYPEAWDFRGGSGGGSWSWQIRDYLGFQSVETWPAKSLLHSRHGTSGIDNIRGWDRERLHHYSASAVLFQDVSDTRGFIRMPMVSEPASTILLGDAPLIRENEPASGCHAAYWSLRGGAVSGNPDAPVEPAALRASVDFWFKGKAHFLFVDGHVEALLPQQVLRKQFQLQR